MPVVRISTWLAAPPELVFDQARDVASAAAAGVRVRPPGVIRGPLDVGDRLLVRPGGPARVQECVPPRTLVLAGGRWRYRQDLLPEAGGTVLAEELRWSGPVPAAPIRSALAARAGHVRLACRRARPVVVGAAIVENGRVLAAQRTEPPQLAGGWELPGGKVDPGETPQAALRRECREELAVGVALGPRAGADVPLASAVLLVWSAVVVAGTPTALEHAELRWLAADELDSVDWLPADRALLPALRSLLSPTPTPPAPGRPGLAAAWPRPAPTPDRPR